MRNRMEVKCHLKVAFSTFNYVISLDIAKIKKALEYYCALIWKTYETHLKASRKIVF